MILKRIHYTAAPSFKTKLSAFKLRQGNKPLVFDLCIAKNIKNVNKNILDKGK